MAFKMFPAESSVVVGSGGELVGSIDRWRHERYCILFEFRRGIIAKLCKFGILACGEFSFVLLIALQVEYS
jgi:hypothetical protein